MSNKYQKLDLIMFILYGKRWESVKRINGTHVEGLEPNKKHDKIMSGQSCLQGMISSPRSNVIFHVVATKLSSYRSVKIWRP